VAPLVTVGRSSAEQELRRAARYLYPQNVAPLFHRNNPAGAFAVDLLDAPAFRVTQAVGGANKVCELLLAKTLNDAYFELRAGSVLDFRRRFGCFVGSYSVIGATATTFAGIEVGSHDANAPFPATPAAAVCQLRRRMDVDGRFEFLTGAGDGVENVQVDTIDLGALAPHGAYLELEVTPSLILAYVDGQLVASRPSSEPSFPQFGGFAPTLDFGVFLTAGTNAGGQWLSGCHFSHAMHEIWWR